MPRRLGAARIIERRLLIVSGSDHGDCEGSCAFPGGEPEGNSSGLLVSLSYLTCGLVFAVSNCVDEVRATPLSRRTTMCWSTQWGLACRQARKPREKNCVSSCDWISLSDWLAFILIGSSHLPRWYNHPTLSCITFFTFLPSVKLFSVASCESLLVWLVRLFS